MKPIFQELYRYFTIITPKRFEHIFQSITDEYKRDLLAQIYGYCQLKSEYNHKKYRWTDDKNNDICLVCYKRRRFTTGQRQFGYHYLRLCEYNCSCEHHKDEIWIG